MFVRHMLRFACWLALTGLAAAGGEPAPRVPPITGEPPRDPALVRLERRQMAASLASQLGSPRYEIREAATKTLEQLGIDAIEPLVTAAGGENLEAIGRAIRALRTIYESGDDATFDAAETALEQLAESSNRSAVQRAAAVLAPPDHFPTPETERLQMRRWRRAIARIRDLGGIVEAADQKGSEKDLAEISSDELIFPMVTLEKGWQGGAGGLVNLKRMAVRTPLPTVYVTDNVGIPAEAIVNLQRAVPGMRVEPRGQAMLGVKFDLDGTCRVKGVKPYSAAHNAGIKPGDVILKYDGESLSSFERLVEITRIHKPGDAVALEVLRGDTKINIVAELTGWAVKKPEEEKK
jgi:hypothetical protein